MDTESLGLSGTTDPALTRSAAPEKCNPVRQKSLPEQFERDDKVIEPGQCVCPDCGAALSALGNADESEALEVKTVTFKVTRHILRRSAA
jgi:transposase